MSSGHIRHYRKEMNSYVWSLKPEYYKVWQTILLSVNWKESTMDFAGEPRTIEPGQMVTGIDNLTKKVGKGVSESQVRRALGKFESADMIERESTNQGSLITVCNWSKYQVLPNQPTSNQQATDKQDTSDSQATHKQPTTYEKGNKGNKEKKEEESNLPGPAPTEFMDYWNNVMPDEHLIRYMTDKRKSKLRTRREEDAFIDNWQTVIDKARNSDFLMDDCRPFDATWVLKNDDNYVKILEGKYDDETDYDVDRDDAEDWDQSDELDPETAFQPTGG